MILFLSTLILGSYFLYKLILKPYLMIRFYKNQGIPSTFVPLLGYLLQKQRDIKQHNDAHYTIKQDIKQNPDLRAFAQNLGSLSILFFADPELQQEFLQKQNSGYYTKSDDLYYLFKGNEDGLLFSEGSKWKKHRKILSQSFHYEFLKQIIPKISSISERIILKQIQDSNKNVSIVEVFRKIAGEVVGKLFFGDNFGQYEIDGVSMPNFISSQMSMKAQAAISLTSLLLGQKFVSKGILPSHKEFQIKREKIYEAGRNIIEEKFKAFRESKESDTMIESQSLIGAFYNMQKLEGAKKENFFTNNEIITEFLTFYAAGSDTTASLLTMSTYYYLKYPEFYKKLHEEIDKYIPDFDNVDVENLNKMDFLTAFQKETLRLFGPAMRLFEREALIDHSISDIKVKKGTLVNIHILAANYNPKFHENPEVFDPYRWLDANSRTMTSINKNQYTFVPFSGGPRNCIGQHLAMFESKVIFCLLVKKFNFVLSDPDFKLNMTQRFILESEFPILYDIEVKGE